MAAQNVQSRCMPVTAAAFQINTAEAADSAEEDFLSRDSFSREPCALGLSQGGTGPSETKV